MKVAVLCPGLATLPHYERTDEDHVLAVNRAVLHVPGRPDWWVFKDIHTFSWCIDDPRFPREHLPTIAAPISVHRKLTRSQPARRSQGPVPALCGPEFTWFFADPPNIHLPKNEWNWFRLSAWSAIAVAFDHLHATEILCVGMDWVGQSDWDGHKHAKQHRDDERWKKEAAEFQQAVACLARRGCSLRRATVAELRQEAAA